MGQWGVEGWKWKLTRYNEVLSEAVAKDFEELCIVLEGTYPNDSADDRFVWPFDPSNYYTVQSGYRFIMQDLNVIEMNSYCPQAMDLIWSAKVPSKLSIFGWRLLRDRLPTKVQLATRGIIQNEEEMLCVFCELYEEDAAHVFIRCPQLRLLWQKIFTWLDLDGQNAQDCPNHLLCCVEAYEGNMTRNRVATIWLTTCWSIWNKRNSIIFSNDKLDVEELYFSIMKCSWWWLAIESKERIKCSFYDWFKNPLVCI
ncbi:uncharacterized protein LOC131635875 [Vicia villosa]|uniref:uncharacterized protein LOC131635875 n=1 Tax=Vicia villosa TaxID=3911 RepID=UPI00273AB09F|nr:uncharacterized protein LOC131635875 [Vicia villosa]